MTPTEHCRVELKLPNDIRALGAVRGALQHTARHLGFPPSEEEQLLALSDQLLRPSLDSLPAGETISVLIQEHPNRVEIELVRPARNGEKWVPSHTLPGIDELKEETAASHTRLKLVKLLPAPHQEDK